MANEKEEWYVCKYDVRHSAKMDAMEYGSMEEAEEYTRKDIEDFLESNAEDISHDANVICRKVAPTEINL